MSESEALQPTTISNDQVVYQLSRRLDETNGMVRDIGARLESYQSHTNAKLDRLVDGMTAMRESQARQDGETAGADKAESKAATKRGLRLQLSNNAIAFASAFFAGCALIVAIVVAVSA